MEKWGYWWAWKSEFEKPELWHFHGKQDNYNRAAAEKARAESLSDVSSDWAYGQVQEYSSPKPTATQMVKSWEAREAKTAPVVFPTSIVLPTVDALARALFRTDGRVIADVAIGALEFTGVPEHANEIVRTLAVGGKYADHYTNGPDAAPKPHDAMLAIINAAFDKAFAADRLGLAAEAAARAADMLKVLTAPVKK